MSTLGDLKARIVSETNRDDLLDDLADALSRAIDRAIEFYAPQRFWFNENILTGATTPGSEYVTIPSTIRTLDRVSVTVGANAYPLTPRSLIDIEDLARRSQFGAQPTDYARYGDTVRLWPMPRQIYPMTFIGVVDLSALAVVGDSNAWTTEAEDLIAARARMLLYRDQFRDADGAATARTSEAEALARLMGETTRRLSTGRVTPSW